MQVWIILAIAILCEVVGTTFLKMSEQFSRMPHVLAMTACYGLSFYLLSLVLRTMPVGVAYAVWSGLGIVLIALVGLVVFGQRLDWAALAGMAMIVGGVVVINLLSRSAPH